MCAVGSYKPRRQPFAVACYAAQQRICRIKKGRQAMKPEALKDKPPRVVKPLDATDLAILSALQHDAKLSNVQLAEHVGLTPTPCLERVRRLERDGVIQSYHARIDAAAVGYSLLVFLNIKTKTATARDNEKFAEAVRALPQVLECYMVAGGSDFLIKARVQDIREYRDFYSQQMAELPGVAEIQSYFVIDEITTHGFLPLAES
jgi:Lrp/AsnC family transcriptional regulator, leucine-responsive regulatory protein